MQAGAFPIKRGQFLFAEKAFSLPKMFLKILISGVGAVTLNFVALSPFLFGEGLKENQKVLRFFLKIICHGINLAIAQPLTL